MKVLLLAFFCDFFLLAFSLHEASSAIPKLPIIDRASINHKAFLPLGALIFSLTSALKPVLADGKRVDGKLEYMPALQGLDYGKV